MQLWWESVPLVASNPNAWETTCFTMCNPWSSSILRLRWEDIAVEVSMLTTFMSCDKISGLNHFILVHGFRGFNPCLHGFVYLAECYGVRSVWWRRFGHYITARKQKDKRSQKWPGYSQRLPLTLPHMKYLEPVWVSQPGLCKECFTFTIVGRGYRNMGVQLLSSACPKESWSLKTPWLWEKLMPDVVCCWDSSQVG